jgi:hypothetical protein
VVVVVVVVVVGTSVVAAAAVVGTLVEAVLVAAILVEVTSAALAVPVLEAFAKADFAQPHIVTGALILPLEVWADRPVHFDITTEAAERLLLGHTNSADGETNR